MATAYLGDNTSQETMDFEGTQDTMIREGPTYDDYNYGIYNRLIIGRTSNKKYRALIAFDLKAFNDAYPYATITSASLHFYADVINP